MTIMMSWVKTHALSQNDAPLKKKLHVCSISRAEMHPRHEFHLLIQLIAEFLMHLGEAPGHEIARC